MVKHNLAAMEDQNAMVKAVWLLSFPTGMPQMQLYPEHSILPVTRLQYGDIQNYLLWMLCSKMAVSQIVFGVLHRQKVQMLPKVVVSGENVLV